MNKQEHAVFGNSVLSQNICATSTEYIDRRTKLEYQFVIDWIVSSICAPLPLRMSPLLNYASILSSDAVVN